MGRHLRNAHIAVSANPLCYADLVERWQEGRDYEIRAVQRSFEFLILAPHGGGIEPGTTEIAEALAGKEFSLYCFNGLLVDRNWDLHLSSVFFDESRCLHLLGNTNKAVAIHGCQGKEPVTWVGGLDDRMKTRVLASLQRVGFEAREDTSWHAGVNPLSLCNRTFSGMGLQLEISLGQRRLFFEGLSRSQRDNPTPAMKDFTQAVHSNLTIPSLLA